ncbi:MAG: oligosaccharide amylase [Acidimicrobiales bacterium]|jgi:oligosaccharide amylase
MSRAATLGNGNMLVGLDYRGQVRDLYYPFVGFSNHVSGASGNFVHRIGVYVDDTISWLDDPQWNITVGCDAETVVGSMHAVNETLGITLSSVDVVHNEENIFIRSFTVGNEKNESRTVKIFLSQQFRISESRRGDTGLYDPRVKAIIHYKGKHTFLINAMHEGKQFTEYNIGLFGIEGKEGTYFDAEDGILEKNPIEHGSVDSIIGMEVKLDPKKHAQFDYWITCGETIAEAHDLNAHVLKETPERLLRSTENYWKAWVDADERDLSLLSPKLQTLYKRSLTTIRVHTDNRGGIIASSDTDMLHHGRDTYSYVWPRDAALIANSLDRSGHSDVAQRFFTFITDKLERGGYFMHKYRSDGCLGSSWHPWIIEGVPEFPIQEDETALVLHMLWKHYEIAKDLEYIESLYNPFIEKAADFMTEFMEARLGLPNNSFDLWEEKFGISTYTASSVYAALTSAAKFASILGKEESARTYSAVAQRIQGAILEHLYDEDINMFIKQIRAYDDKDDVRDTTVDISSFFGPVYFGVVEPHDPRVRKALQTVEETLRVHSNATGYIRYEGDTYYTLQETGTPNPWVITTLWMAQYYIMSSDTLKGLEQAYQILEWTCAHATKSGVLAEQMHPQTGEHLSTAPLTWSHAEYVTTVDEYLKKHAELSEQ